MRVNAIAPWVESRNGGRGCSITFVGHRGCEEEHVSGSARRYLDERVRRRVCFNHPARVTRFDLEGSGTGIEDNEARNGGYKVP